MKLMRIILATVSLVALFSFIPTAYADSKVADCAEFRNPTSTASATTITLRVDVYALCSVEQLGRGKGQSPLYEMPQEESLFNLSSCSGPSITQRVGNGWLGTATCSLRVGSNTLPSPRTGATSTTIKMWFAWDFSTKSISVPHIAIPAPTNNGWGGSSSGSSGGSSGGSSAPVVKNCTSAPETPTLSITWNEKGPLFKFSPASNGNSATLLDWNYALYDSVKSAWDPWTSWKEIYPAASGEHQAVVIPDKSKIAFAVYATNACGSSVQAREVSSNTGVPLAPLVMDELTLILRDPTRVEVGQQLDIYGITRSKLLLPLNAKSTTPNYCEVMSNGQVRMLSAGDCQLQVSSTSFQEKAGSPAVNFKVTIKPNRVAQIVPNLNINQSYDISKSPITLELLTDVKLQVGFTALTDETCFVAGRSLVFRTRGICQISATQDGDENTLPAETRVFSIQITQSKSTISCIKGKTNKKLTGYSPKCPAGYKVKK